ncbi:MAG: sterol desaturase family protein [Ignavibacteriaceae bacterium]|nr:sterol desaturase family protein [Ignavibacteriaceae bacterium]MCW9095437.1 sterol desaturase family protein [Ignavibacteriaceae bacterium]
MPKNYVSNKDETVRMFESDFMEAFSRVHYTVPLFIYIPVILVMLYLSVAVYSISILNIIVLIIGGLAAWSLAEYLLHRFVFHFKAKSEFGKKIHFIFHGVHHDYPSDSKRLVMPPSVSIPLAVLFFFIFRLIFGESLMLPFFAGFILGYLFYDISHYAIHHFNMHSKFWLAIKNHHMLHHYQDEYKGYGVSSPFWDYVFRTDFIKKKS